MKNEIKCLYCGSVMRLEYGHEIGISYACPECWSESPFIKYKGGEDTKALCYEAALRRPLQKPLTKKELHALIDAGEETVIYCETKFYSGTYATIIYDGKVFDRYGKGPGVKHFSFETYGKTWRAWASRPTDEERAAAPWEE